MAISTLWPKPPRWQVQPGAVDPGQRWVWHTRPRFILPMWEHASAGAAQRYGRLAQTRRTARTWQLNTGAAAMQTRYGPGVSIPRPTAPRSRRSPAATRASPPGSNGDMALIACFASSWTRGDGAALARRSVRLPALMERGPRAHGQRATSHAPSTGAG